MEKQKPQYEFSVDKNKQLIKERHISFEDVVAALNNGKLLDVLDHPNTATYPNQKIYIVNMNDYAYLVPFVIKDTHTVFLKTIFPSRKLTKKYIRKGGEP